jgi:nitrilase
VIYGPDGARMGDKLAPDQEGIIYADIDLGMISVAKAAADPAGHYARPDVTRLLFNNRPANRVEHFSLPLQQGSESVAGSDQPAPVRSSKDSAEPAVRPVAAE